MVDYVNVYSETPQPVPSTSPLIPEPSPSTWTIIKFLAQTSDSADHWRSTDPCTVARASSTGNGLLVDGLLELRLEDFPSDSQVHFHQIELDSSGTIVEYSENEEFQTQTGHADPDRTLVTHKRFPIWAYVNAGHRLQFRITQMHDDPSAWPDGSIRRARCMLKATPR